MNRADKISQMFYARRDEKRQQLVGKSPKTKEIGLWKSLPANKRVRKDKVGK